MPPGRNSYGYRFTLLEEVVAFVAAAVAAVAARAALFYFAPHLMHGLTTDPVEVRFVVGAAFFAVLIALGRRAFKADIARSPETVTDPAAFNSKETPQETAKAMARVYADVADEDSRQRAILDWLGAVPKITAMVPMAFYFYFGEIGPIGWGFTVFLDVLCLLWSIGLFFLPRTEYHTPVPLRGDWLDRIGAFWLVGCAFGPLFGWMITNALPVTPGSWRWLYGLRAFLAAALPVVLALPLLRYVRGKSNLVALPLLVVITLLPVLTAVEVIQDLRDGPSVRRTESGKQAELYLRHTERSLGRAP